MVGEFEGIARDPGTLEHDLSNFLNWTGIAFDLWLFHPMNSFLRFFGPGYLRGKILNHVSRRIKKKPVRSQHWNSLKFDASSLSLGNSQLTGIVYSNKGSVQSTIVTGGLSNDRERKNL